jgi:hypothetical protein
MAGLPGLGLVKLETQPGTEVSSSSWSSLLPAFLLFASFEGIALWAALRAPLQVTSTTLYHPISQDYLEEGVWANATIAPGNRKSDLISIFVSIARYSLFDSLERSANITGIYGFFLNDGIVYAPRKRRFVNESIVFEIGGQFSKELNIFNGYTKDFDSMNISVLFRTDFHGLSGFRFVCTYPDSAVFPNAVRIGLSVCALYGLLGFVACMRKGIYRPGQGVLVLLATAAVLAPNPISIVVPSLDFFTVPLKVSFLMIYRSMTLGMICDRIGYSGTASDVVESGIVLCYLVLESWVGLGFPAEELGASLLSGFHVIYAVMIFGLVLWAVKASSEHLRLQVIGHGVLLVICAAMAVVSEVILGEAKSDSTKSLLLYLGSHVLSSIVFLFLQYSPVAGYQNIATKEPVMLDIGLGEEDPD